MPTYALPTFHRTYTAPPSLLELLGVRLAEGADGGAPATVDPAPADPRPGDGSAPAGATTDADQAGWSKTDDAPQTFDKAYVEGLRAEAAKYRTQLRDITQSQQTQMDTLAKALGLKSDDEKPDPAALAEQLSAQQAAARTASVELAIFRTATAAGADPDALLDSRSFLAKVSGLDPSEEGFTTAVTDAVKAAVEANPKLRQVRVAGASSVDHSAGGSGEGRRSGKPRPLHAAVTDALNS